MKLRWLAYTGAIVFGVLTVAPVYLMVKISLAQPSEVLTAHPTLLPHAFVLRHWQGILASGNLWQPLAKSLDVATLATLLGLLIAAPAAYVIARWPQGLRYTVILALFASRMFPDVGIALPISVRFIAWNLTDTVLGLVLAHLILILPIATWILVGTFETVPASLEEAARVDGAGLLATLSRVVLPLAAPGLAVAAIWSWLLSWNEFTYALYLSLSTRTLPLATYYYVARGDWFQSASYATLLTIPVLVVTFVLQRYLRSGYLAGAIKG